MLVSTIIDDLLELTRRSKDQALAYFYLWLQATWLSRTGPAYWAVSSNSYHGKFGKIPGLIVRIHVRDQQTGSGKLELEELSDYSRWAVSKTMLKIFL